MNNRPPVIIDEEGINVPTLIYSIIRLNLDTPPADPGGYWKEISQSQTCMHFA
jgi:hypothetical protein